MKITFLPFSIQRSEWGLIQKEDQNGLPKTDTRVDEDLKNSSKWLFISSPFLCINPYTLSIVNTEKKINFIPQLIVIVWYQRLLLVFRARKSSCRVDRHPNARCYGSDIIPLESAQ